MSPPIRSTNGVNDHLKALERKGYLTRDNLKSRALRPVDKGITTIPLFGEVAAGQPLLAVENYEEQIKVDRFFIDAPERTFALQVKGDSMIEDGIYDGDYVFVRQQQTAHKGDVVVALVDDEATVKRYYPEGDRVRLQPANATMAPIIVDRSSGKALVLLGLVVGVYRRM